VLYDLLSTGRQVQLHRRIAEREEAGYGERAGEVATELAHHYSSANDRNKAVRYYRLAGERAVARGAAVEGEAHYSRALALLSELPETTERDRQELALQIALGGVLWTSRSWGYPETSRAYTRALELTQRLAETKHLVVALKGLMAFANANGRYKQGRELAERILAAAERGGDRASQCAAHTRLGENLIWCAQFVEAQRHLELGSGYYDEADRSELGLMGFDAPALAAITVLLLGFPDRARQLMNEALRRLEGREDPFWVGIVHVWGGMLSVLLRNAQATLEHAQALHRLANKEPVWTGAADANMARALMLLGKRAEGIVYLRKAIAFSKSFGLIAHLMRAKLDEIEFFTKEGRINDGLALIAEGLTDSEELVQIRAPVLRYSADLLALSGADATEVEVAYRTAIECARDQGARYYELQATTSFARWFRSRNRPRGARDARGDLRLVHRRLRHRRSDGSEGAARRIRRVADPEA